MITPNRKGDELLDPNYHEWVTLNMPSDFKTEIRWVLDNGYKLHDISQRSPVIRIKKLWSRLNVFASKARKYGYRFGYTELMEMLVKKIDPNLKYLPKKIDPDMLFQTEEITIDTIPERIKNRISEVLEKGYTLRHISAWSSVQEIKFLADQIERFIVAARERGFSSFDKDAFMKIIDPAYIPLVNRERGDEIKTTLTHEDLPPLLVYELKQLVDPATGYMRTEFMLPKKPKTGYCPTYKKVSSFLNRFNASNNTSFSMEDIIKLYAKGSRNFNDVDKDLYNRAKLYHVIINRLSKLAEDVIFIDLNQDEELFKLVQLAASQLGCNANEWLVFMTHYTPKDMNPAMVNLLRTLQKQFALVEQEGYQELFSFENKERISIKVIAYIKQTLESASTEVLEEGEK